MKRSTLIFIIGLILLWNLHIYTEEQKDSKIEELIDMSKEFVTQLEEGDFKDAVKNFDSTMKSAMPEQKLSDTWQVNLIGLIILQFHLLQKHK